ncbi:alpha/beta fold hydrolase [Nonomuraea terrae]|uniref:Alpha/beta fold hydrolase n=1 Tax=Nonomuraea terrae TaxID=2530383 RepID=A0A4R4Y7C8_9ACTN|nr:alpha/beta fold hydrolase [Nonomuraea terrae]TDD38922.1 alpha/beta fold hydrolase [Nonomuraea terrae]
MERRLYVFAACAFIVAAVLGSAWVTGQFTTPLVDRTNGYVSELGARDQPWTRLFRVCEALSGLACAFGVALVPRAPMVPAVPRMAREWPGWLALAAFGLLTFAGGLFPLDCAALSDTLCGRTATSLAHRAHLLAGVLSTGAVLAAMAVLSARWRSWASWLFTLLTLAATALTGAGLAAGHGVGLAHRAQLTLIAVWLVYVAMRLLVVDGDEEEQVPLRVAPGRAGGVGGARGQAPDPTIGYGRPHVVEEGTGPTVLITTGPGAAWFHWDAVAVALAAGHRVIRFDRPGLGLSPRSPAPPSLYAEVARLAALSPDHPEQVIVVAHGVACWHAEAFARLHPLCLAKLVLVEPACPGGRRPLPAARSAGRWLPALGGTWGAAALARLTGPAAHRLLTGLPDPSGVYRMGKVPAAVAGEWLARRDMAADLLRLRADKPFPPVPVTVIDAYERDGCRERLPGDLGAALVRLPAAGRPVPLRDPDVIVEAVAAR